MKLTILLVYDYKQMFYYAVSTKHDLDIISENTFLVCIIVADFVVTIPWATVWQTTGLATASGTAPCGELQVPHGKMSVHKSYFVVIESEKEYRPAFLLFKLIGFGFARQITRWLSLISQSLDDLPL